MVEFNLSLLMKKAYEQNGVNSRNILYFAVPCENLKKVAEECQLVFPLKTFKRIDEQLEAAKAEPRSTGQYRGIEVCRLDDITQNSSEKLIVYVDRFALGEKQFSVNMDYLLQRMEYKNTKTVFLTNHTMRDAVNLCKRTGTNVKFDPANCLLYKDGGFLTQEQCSTEFTWGITFNTKAKKEYVGF